MKMKHNRHLLTRRGGGDGNLGSSAIIMDTRYSTTEANQPLVSTRLLRPGVAEAQGPSLRRTPRVGSSCGHTWTYILVETCVAVCIDDDDDDVTCG